MFEITGDDIARLNDADLRKGSLFWRAALGHDWRPIGEEDDDEIPCAHPPKRMKPLPGRASDGRANPRGIPCLYMATTKEAAMSEVRPWIGSFVSAGQFRTNRALTVVDCSRRPDASPFFFSVDDFNYEPEADIPRGRRRSAGANLQESRDQPRTARE